MWFLMMLANVAFGILNPYVGLFTVFNIVQLFIMLCFYCVSAVKVKQFNLELSSGRRTLLLKLIKTSLIAFGVTSIVLFGISSFVNVVIHMLMSGRLDDLKSSVTFDILGIKNNMGCCDWFLVLQLGSGVFAMIFSVTKALCLLRSYNGYKFA